MTNAKNVPEPSHPDYTINAATSDFSRTFSNPAFASEVYLALPDGLLITNADGHIVSVNPLAEKLLGLTAAEILNTTLEEALAEISLRAHQPERLHKILTSLETAPLQPLLIDLAVNGLPGNNDDEKYLRLVFFPVNGGWSLQIHDASPDRVADQLKNEFIAVVSHELRMPLSAMQGFSELLLTQDATPERRRMWMEMIHRESVRLSGLIEDMLSLSHVEAGRVNLRLERLDVEPVIRQSVEILRIGSSKHSFKVEVAENVSSVRADRDKLTQVLNNIVGNALKYSPRGGLITISANYANNEEGFLRVSVSDQGVGIPESEIPRVFEKFYRVGGGQEREIKGSGLGLAITRKLIELMGGRIWVESTLGVGSTFFFTLPTHTFPKRELEAFKEILLKTLLVPNKDATEAELYLDYLNRTLPHTQLDEVLRDTLYEVGNLWHMGKIGVGDEHFATNVVREYLTRLRPAILSVNGYRLVIGGVAGEEHTVGLTMVSNAFARGGWNVTSLGANVPVSAFITTLEQVKPDVLLLSLAMSQRLVEVKRVIHEVREAFPQIIIGVGGRITNDVPDFAQRLGADFHAANPDETVHLATELVQARPGG